MAVERSAPDDTQQLLDQLEGGTLRQHSNGLGHVSPALLNLQREIERISQSPQLSYTRLYTDFEKTLQSIQQQHSEFARIAATSQSLPFVRMAEDVTRANQRWQDMAAQATASSRMISDLATIHETWAKTFELTQDKIAKLQAATAISLGGMAYRLTVSERLFANLDFEVIRRATALPEQTVLKLRDSIVEVTGAYGRLAESIHTYPDVTHLPSFGLPGATREVFVVGHAVDVLRVSEYTDSETVQGQLTAEIEKETSISVELLQGLNKFLAAPYLGAREALRGKNPDRARHVLASLRELWNHVLRFIAPNEQVTAWVGSRGEELLYDGHPTRKARVLYVCRELNHGPLADFVDRDTKALVELIEVCNRVHELESTLTDYQLWALILRTDSWLAYILQISGCSRRS